MKQMAKAKKLPSGNWRVCLYLGQENGKRKYKSFTASTKKEAEYLAAQYNFDSKLYSSASQNLTLHNAVERYIESKRNILSPSTVRGYYVILNNYCPELMDMQVFDLTQEAIQISLNNLAADYSSKTCRNVHGLIYAALRMYRPELILHTTLPRKTKKYIYVPDGEEIKNIYRLSVGKIIEVPIFLAAECGLRASEISALRIENVMPTHIIIMEAVVLGDDGKEHRKAPKSYSGYRKIPISFAAFEFLKSKSDKDGRICPYRADRICNEWCKFRKKHDINKNLNFHAFRHHYASKCILLGIPQKYIAELMGHSSTEMIENVYQHIFPSAMEEYLNRLRLQMDDLCSTKSSL